MTGEPGPDGYTYYPVEPDIAEAGNHAHREDRRTPAGRRPRPRAALRNRGPRAPTRGLRQRGDALLIAGLIAVVGLVAMLRLAAKKPTAGVGGRHT